MDLFEPIRKAAEDLHHQVAGDGTLKKPMELVNVAITHLTLELTWLPTGDSALKGAKRGDDRVMEECLLALCGGPGMGEAALR